MTSASPWPTISFMKRLLLCLIFWPMVACDQVPVEPDLCSTSARMTPNGAGSQYAEFTVIEPVAWESFCVQADSEPGYVGVIAYDDMDRASVLAYRSGVCLTPDLLDMPHDTLLPGLRYMLTATVQGEATAEVLTVCADGQVSA